MIDVAEWCMLTTKTLSQWSHMCSCVLTVLLLVSYVPLSKLSKKNCVSTERYYAVSGCLLLCWTQINRLRHIQTNRFFVNEHDFKKSLIQMNGVPSIVLVDLASNEKHFINSSDCILGRNWLQVKGHSPHTKPIWITQSNETIRGNWNWHWINTLDLLTIFVYWQI